MTFGKIGMEMAVPLQMNIELSTSCKLLLHKTFCVIFLMKINYISRLDEVPAQHLYFISQYLYNP